MLDLTTITDADVSRRLEQELDRCGVGDDRWRVIGATLRLTEVHSFIGTRTYPRPDHPDPRKRLPLPFLMVAILVSLRTTIENEQRAMDRLIDRYPTTTLLSRATPGDLAECITSSGMAETKSKRILDCLDRISHLDGGLESLATWEPKLAREYLLSLPGFGPKASDCLLTIGLGHASMVVDVNVFRVTTALLGLKWNKPPTYSNPKQVAEVKAHLDNAIGDDVFLCQIVHTILLLEGKRRRVAHGSGLCDVSEYCRTCESML